MFPMQKPLSNGERVRQLYAMRIAVISDTHDRCPPSLPKRLRGADEVWHLGDVCAPAMLDEVAGVGKPLFVVRGNCDENDAWPLELDLEREGKIFHLIHIPPSRAPSGCSAVLHGHTHLARDEMIDGVRWLNPGSLTRPREGAPSFAWLTVMRGKLTSWEVVRV
jgi:putative phosphoesterase